MLLHGIRTTNLVHRGRLGHPNFGLPLREDRLHSLRRPSDPGPGLVQVLRAGTRLLGFSSPVGGIRVLRAWGVEAHGSGFAGEPGEGDRRDGDSGECGGNTLRLFLSRNRILFGAS